jgi:anti-anti-sigma factor
MRSRPGLGQESSPKRFQAGVLFMPQEPQPISASGFSMRTETRDGATLVFCAGRLTSEHSDTLKKHGRSLVPHAKRLVLDFAEIVRMDSSGLGALVGIYVSAKKANCEFLLINYNSSIKDLLGITNILSMFEDCARSGMRMP